VKKNDDEKAGQDRIVDTKVVNDKLAELVIVCGKCGSALKLAGFQQVFDA
jgi:hypothetical protein